MKMGNGRPVFWTGRLMNIYDVIPAAIPGKL